MRTRTVLILLLVTAIAQYLGKSLNLYNLIWEYDSFMHILGGMFAGSVGIYCLSFLNFSKKKFNIYAATLSSALVIGVFWELGQRYMWSALYPFLDTIIDLIMDMAGGLLVAFYCSRRT